VQNPGKCIKFLGIMDDKTSVDRKDNLITESNRQNYGEKETEKN